ncbi:MULTISPECIES: hypothetical protein [unclassified Bradyrhizobium]|uniref:hypothetical protein n=1 Tax=unclassified Bradyrhizobium TaxID=2631580 RepID=UPI0028E2C32E|nr:MULTISPECIES: hypothetical protein [unclassified Bradyrhizobium]
MLKIVANPSQAKANIRKFETELKRSPDLQARLAYARAWYADKDENGQWHFGPSKFIGYQDIDAKKYLASAEDSDGRRTEAQLQSWFDIVDPQNPLHTEVHSALLAFLAEYGKTPSAMARINVERKRRALPLLNMKSKDNPGALVSLLVEVAACLPEEQFRELRGRLEEIWS